MSGDLTKRWISVLILCFINLINYMDRYTIAGKYLTNFAKMHVADGGTPGVTLRFLGKATGKKC